MSAARSDPEALRFGARVRITDGPDQGGLGVVTSILSDRRETYYQVQLDRPEQGEAGRIIMGLVKAGQLEVSSEQE